MKVLVALVNPSLKAYDIDTVVVDLPDDFDFVADSAHDMYEGHFKKLLETAYNQSGGGFCQGFAMLKPEYRWSTRVIAISRLG